MAERKRRIIGVTGGVGSGKSTVLNLLRDRWGAEIIQADEVARELMEPGGSSYRAVVEAFGEGICRPDGRIDRGHLAEIIFREEGKRQQLGALTHPLVKEEVQRRMRESASSLIVYEAALPREACMRELCGEIWAVHVPEEIRIRRLMSDRGYSREKCEEIMRSQLPEEEFLALADRVIENGGTPEEAARQVRRLLEGEG